MFVISTSSLVLNRVFNKYTEPSQGVSELQRSYRPGERVVKDECVFSGIPDFQFPLDSLFVGVTASQRDQDLWRAKDRHLV